MYLHGEVGYKLKIMYVPVGYTQVLRPVILMNIGSHSW